MQAWKLCSRSKGQFCSSYIDNLLRSLTIYWSLDLGGFLLLLLKSKLLVLCMILSFFKAHSQEGISIKRYYPYSQNNMWNICNPMQMWLFFNYKILSYKTVDINLGTKLSLKSSLELLPSLNLFYEAKWPSIQESVWLRSFILYVS